MHMKKILTTLILSATIISISVANNNLGSEIKTGNIYPNPANQFINVPVNLKSAGKLEVYNILGELVLTQMIPENTTMLIVNTSDLASGSYITYVVSDDFKGGSHKFTVNHSN